MNIEKLEQYSGIAANIEALREEINALYTPISSPNGHTGEGHGTTPGAPTERAAMRILALLLENAVKFTEEGSVTLRMVPEEGFMHFLVEDTGIGVPAEDAERIFERFVQLDDYREGTGIGLSLARSLARRLGGEVVLDTSYTLGARFVFSLRRPGRSGSGTGRCSRTGRCPGASRSESCS